MRGGNKAAGVSDRLDASAPLRRIAQDDVGPDQSLLHQPGGKRFSIGGEIVLNCPARAMKRRCHCGNRQISITEPGKGIVLHVPGGRPWFDWNAIHAPRLICESHQQVFHGTRGRGDGNGIFQPHSLAQQLELRTNQAPESRRRQRHVQALQRQVPTQGLPRQAEAVQRHPPFRKAEDTGLFIAMQSR